MEIKTTIKNSDSRQAKAQEDTFFRIMRLIEEQPDVTQRDLADRIGISLGALNYCLKALMEKGFIKLDNFQNSKHKFKYVYILTPAGFAAKATLAGRFLKRKMAEYEALRVEIEGLKAEIPDDAGERGSDASGRFSDESLAGRSS